VALEVVVGDVFGGSRGDGVHDEIWRRAVISRVWSASPFASSVEAEGWLERAWAAVCFGW
jgi:hypothetical protein